jgi:preprotein translocase subunit SecF
MQIFHNPNYNFVKWRWHAIAVSWVVIVAGLLTIWQKGLPLGVEFSGGSIVIVRFDKVPEISPVRAALDRAMPGTGQNSIVQRYGDAGLNQLMIRVPSVGAESGGELSATADAVVAALNKGGLGINGNCLSPTATNCVAGTQIVGPIVGKQLTRQGTLATVLALGGILLYVAMRFQLSFAVGAVVATVHDLLVTLAVLAFFRYDLSLNVIAAILTITGYSVNDTIVIFDRVRENMRNKRREPLDQVVNTAVNQTLGRTIITAGTAFLSVLALFLFGGEALRGFSFTMLVGIVSGTYSTIFIASAIAIILSKKQPTAAAPAADTAARTSRKQKGAKAS